MNLEKNPKVEELRELLRRCDDHAGHHVLWVAKNGEVRVSKVPKDKTPVRLEESEPEMQLRYETFQAGNEYVGPDAAEDDEWVKQVYDTLLHEWPKAKGKPTVGYVNEF